MEPIVILVDYKDTPLGIMEKSKAHETANLHRAFSVFLYNGTKLLLQKRAPEKYHCGGLWTNTCCSHPAPGEATLLAAQRRLQEELSIKTGKLEELYSFIYYYKFENGLTEYEYDHVILGEYDGTYQIDPAEAETAQWIEIEELLTSMRTNPKAYTPWFLTSAPEVIKVILNRQHGKPSHK